MKHTPKHRRRWFGGKRCAAVVGESARVDVTCMKCGEKFSPETAPGMAPWVDHHGRRRHVRHVIRFAKRATSEWMTDLARVKPERPEMGSAADEAYWSIRFAEITTGHQKAVDALYAGIIDAQGWDPDEFQSGYLEIVSERAWIDHDVRETTGVDLPIVPPVAVGPRLTAAQAKRVRKRENRARGELVSA